jgi:hypothetical protein
METGSWWAIRCQDCGHRSVAETRVAAHQAFQRHARETNHQEYRVVSPPEAADRVTGTGARPRQAPLRAMLAVLLGRAGGTCEGHRPAR